MRLSAIIPVSFFGDLCHNENRFVCHTDRGFPRRIEENLFSAVLAIAYTFPAVIISYIQIRIANGA